MSMMTGMWVVLLEDVFRQQRALHSRQTEVGPGWHRWPLSAYPRAAPLAPHTAPSSGELISPASPGHAPSVLWNIHFLGNIPEH